MLPKAIVMFREAIDVGAFTWSRVQRFYDSDPAVHWQRCEMRGLRIATWM
jgi:hypothetical protein